MATKKLKLKPRFCPETYRHLNELCRLQARPKVILSLMPNIGETQIAAHWRAVNEKAPKQGPATRRASSFWATQRLRLHSSFALKRYTVIENSGAHFIDAYIIGYQDYLEAFAHDAPQSFDWFWGLVQNYLNEQIVMMECQCCKLPYIHNPQDLKNDRNCPSRRLFIEAEKATERYEQKEVGVDAGLIVLDHQEIHLPNPDNRPH